MTRTPKAASAAHTGPSTTGSDAQPVDEDAAAPAPAPAPADDGSDSDSSDGEIPLCDAPVVKKRKVEAQTSQISMTDSERYKRDDAGCADRLKKREADQMVPCIDPEIGEDDQGVGARFQGYDGFTIGGPPVFR
uniref:Uncharacterized protein n=1 Tax=Pelagomonas calceolata TaxID=35677 RepID=A0A7S4A443_9STRA|mmetsp:Transcript_21665/g.56576  ORF Transcript_21665/g.56576 Transcript_21665/m.56576 type:complete len:134 (-) Transcript_21665:93-494(-)